MIRAKGFPFAHNGLSAMNRYKNQIKGFPFKLRYVIDPPDVPYNISTKKNYCYRTFSNSQHNIYEPCYLVVLQVYNYTRAISIKSHLSRVLNPMRYGLTIYL